MATNNNKKMKVNAKQYLCPSCNANTDYCTCIGINWTASKAAKYGVLIE
jgi:hypothetical protein